MWRSSAYGFALEYAPSQWHISDRGAAGVELTSDVAQVDLLIKGTSAGSPGDLVQSQLSDLRDSGSIEQDADVVLFLYREGMHKPDIDRNRTELIVAKNRNGPVDDIELIFNPEQTTFREPYPHNE